MSSENDDLIVAAIDAAEEIREPLDGLVKKVAADPSSPFVPKVLNRLAALKQEDRAAFEALRAQLKNAGCRVTALDQAIADQDGEAARRIRESTVPSVNCDFSQKAQAHENP